MPEVSPDLNIPRFRCQGKRTLDVVDPPDPSPPIANDGHECFKQARAEPQEELGQAEATDQSRDWQGHGREGKDHANDRAQGHEDRLRETQGTEFRGSSSSTGLRRMGGEPCESREEQSHDADVRGIPESWDQGSGSADGGRSRVRGHKRGPSDEDREYQETWRTGRAVRREDREGRLRSLDRDHGGTLKRDDSAARGNLRPQDAHESDGNHPDADRKEAEHRIDRINNPRHRSRTPHRDPANIRREESTELSRPVQLNTIPEECDEKTDMLFAQAVESAHTVEIHLSVSARDVHCKRGTWVLNQKAKRNVEVNFRKLNEEDRKEFLKAMGHEVDSFTSNSAVEICARAGVPRQRILGMRWVLVWKPVQDKNGMQVARKAKSTPYSEGIPGS